MSSDPGEDVNMDELSRDIENGQNLVAELANDDDVILDDDGSVFLTETITDAQAVTIENVAMVGSDIRVEAKIEREM